MIRTNIKMRVTPEQNRLICTILDKEWLYFDKAKCIYIFRDRIESSYSNKDWNTYCALEEIDADLFIKTNGTCEETYLTKYTNQPKDIKSALKKIENLHIALNKKRDKNKNQALEITKLLEQKKNMQEVIDLNYRDIKRLESNLSIFADSSKETEKMFDSQIKFMTEAHKLHTDTLKEEYQSKLKEKDTIISYLEKLLRR